ncbi:MAG: TIM barrel protein [Roseibacillus sp.]|jgi:sugar phosphate isomerase/epimerase|nr:sugar phosphate isomerase/epimerase [Roseibacillus sp.]MDP7306098.1 TIM barrel protein [Roseibacillus sp.]HJM63281.1 TIM barrel protein [Roseibacillus sp.]|tara:strand:+ start:10468 stop:11445 length:978 start_codon:yes stop_codon:yes gene_type:complete
MLAFSTCWNNSRHSDGESMIEEILSLGVNHIELSHGMTIAKLPGIRRAFEGGAFHCCGVHNYFPSPTEVIIDAPDAYEFTSHRPHDRTRALEMTFRSLEFAAEFKARYMVLHMGSVPLMPHRKWTGRLVQMLKEGRQLDPKYDKLKSKCVKKRSKTGGLYFNRALETLEKLVEKAAEYRVKLAIESRSRYEDVPAEQEMVALQQHFSDNEWIGYWHDFGHVQLKHNLRLLEHEHWLGEMEPYLIGAHVHDVAWPQRDHQVPFTGTLDYDDLLKHLRPEMPHVWELSPGRKEEEIRLALQCWKEKFPDTLTGIGKTPHHELPANPS